MHQGDLSNQVHDKSEEVSNQELENGIARGYIHNVSPLRNNNSYFDFEVQTKYKTIRAVCFSPKKRKLIDTHSKNETPVELKGPFSSEILCAPGSFFIYEKYAIFFEVVESLLYLLQSS